MTNTNTRQPAADDAATPEAARPSEPTPNTRPTGEGSPPAPQGAGSEGSALHPIRSGRPIDYEALAPDVRTRFPNVMGRLRESELSEARQPLIRCDLGVSLDAPAEFSLSAVVVPGGTAVAVITGVTSPALADAAIAILREMADKLEAGA